jgi:hypothetical protein
VLLGAGVSFLTEEDFTAVGFSVSVAKDIRAMNKAAIGIVADFGWNKDSQTIDDFDANVTLTTFLGGVRFTGTSNDKFGPFGQVLVGGTRASFGTDVAGIDIGDSETAFTVAFGGGINVRLYEQVNFLAELDYLHAAFEGEAANFWRFLFGISLRLGQ